MPLADTLVAQRKRVEEAAKPVVRAPVRIVPTIRRVVERITTPLYPVVGGGAHTSQAPRSGHMGLDIGARQGSKVVAPVSGVITRQQASDRGYGTAVWMLDPVSGNELTFGHMLREFVDVGQRIVAGQVLGEVGSTGASTGPHLHFEVGRPGADPFGGQATEQGAIDPLAWLRGAKPSMSTIADPIVTSGLRSASPTLPPPGKAGRASPGQTPAILSGLPAKPTVEIPASSGFGVVGVPGGIKPETMKANVQAADKGQDLLGLGWVKDAINPDKPASAAAKLKGYIGRAGFIGAGMAFIFLGFAVFAFAYREEIAKVGGAAVGAAAGNPAAAAGLVTAAVVAPP